MTDQNVKQSVPDIILSLQLMAAWAGEGMSEPKRLDWWQTDLADEEGGGDLFSRLFPRTHLWASLEAVRKAAIHIDSQARLAMAKPDQLRTLFFWGFDMDEKLNERLLHHKNKLISPAKALPLLACIYAPFDKEKFEEAIHLPGQTVKYKIAPGGREITDQLPDAPELKAKHLTAALLPLGDRYPVPFFRVNE